MSDRPSISVSTIQKISGGKRRTSLAKEAQEFKDRNEEGWQDNSETKNCTMCRAKFTLTNRRHHCRGCGNIFCGKCSSFKTVIAGEMKRSCLSCYKKAVRKDNAQNSVVINTKTGAQLPQTVLTSSAPAPSEVEAARPSEASTEGTDLPPWAEALLFIRKAGADGPTLKASFPEDCLTEEMLQDVYLNALPQPLRGNKKQEIKYFFRVRDKQVAGAPEVRDENDETVGSLVTKTTVFYNCYVFYRQQVVYDAAGDDATSPSNGTLMRQAVILVSKWPFPRLAFRMLEKVDEAFYWSAESSKRANSAEGGSPARSRALSSSGSYSPTKSTSSGEGGSIGWDLALPVISNVLMVGFGQLAVWPTATPSALIYLHFFGELLQYNVAANIWSTYGANLSFSSILPSINLVALFAPLGLLHHLWILWELLISGQDIVVVGRSPTQCSEVVLALSSLLLPLFRVTDLRPYLHEDDSDVALIGATAQMKYEKMFEGPEGQAIGTNKSMIVGVTNPAVLSEFECFGAMLILPPPRKDSDRVAAANGVDPAFAGLRSKNAAIHHQFAKTSVVKKLTSGKIFKKRSSVTATVAKGSGNSGSFVDYFSSWQDNGAAMCALVCRHEGSAFPMKKLLVKIRNMNPAVRNVLGDKLLRDNLSELTLSFFRPIAGSEGIEDVEASNIKESLLERAELAEVRAQSAPEGSGKGGSILTPDDLWAWAMTMPRWMAGNVPTVIMWVGYFAAFLIGYFVGIPPVLLLAGGFLVKVPEKATPEIEGVLATVLPAWMLGSSDGKSTPAADSSAADASKNSYEGKDVAAPVKVDLSGVWKRVRLENYDALLAAQGAGFVQRKMAASIAMVHTITMDEGCTVFRLQEKGGPIDTDNTYVIDGPEVASNTMKSNFLDKVTRVGGAVRMRKLIMPGQEYELSMDRDLIDGGKTLRVRCTYRDLKGKAAPVVGSTYFELVGPSPNARPEGVAGSTPEPSAAKPAANKAAAAASPATHTDLSGAWQRTKTANFEAFVGASGAGFMQRKLAASMALTHTITMDPTLQAFALHEKGGPIDTRQVLTVGAAFQPIEIQGKKFKQRCYWQREALVFIRRIDDESFEHQLTRTIDESGAVPQIILKSVHRDLLTSKEVEATSWFTKSGPSPNPVPKPDLSLVVKDGAASSDDLAGAAEVEVEDDLDNDSDDDAQAMAKVRSLSTAGGLLASKSKSSASLSNLTGALTAVSKNMDFGGVWIQNNATNFDATHLDATMTVSHTISMSKREVKVKEAICGRTVDDTTLSVDADPVGGEYLGKPVRSRVYFEGRTLVVHRVSEEENTEYFVRRDLEEGGKVLRLVTLQRNQDTAEESESMALFSNAKWLN